MSNKGYDFAGWATKNNLKCADGKIIRHGAFKESDGEIVPLVWNHRHESVKNILGHAVLENRDQGVYAYCYLNNSADGLSAKEAIQHGDIESLSIYANNVNCRGNDIVHGSIREVSLVMVGANPGAYIESVVAHGVAMDEDEDEAIFFSGEGIVLAHAAEDEEDDDMDSESKKKKTSGKTVGDVYDEMSEEQKVAVAAIVGQALADAKGGSQEKEDKEEEEEKMYHSAFEGRNNKQESDDGILIHSEDIAKIMSEAKSCGSLKKAVSTVMGGSDIIIAHAADRTGMTAGTGTNTYGIRDADMLFPDFKATSNTPIFISRNMDWVSKVMNKVHKVPFSRIKSLYADITEDDARARGYIKGKMKKDEFFTILKRTTTATMVYKKQKMDRQDILEIVEFDVVAWLKAEMRMMLEEEIARAILIGDGRLTSSDDHIPENNVRPIAKDVGLFNTVVEIDLSAGYDTIVDDAIRARKNYKGSGNPDFFTTETVLTEMLLLKDKNGTRLYKTIDELKTALRVNDIVTVEPMENHTVNVDRGAAQPLLGIIVNLSDYTVGADKGGQTTMFEDFDIDFNQEKYLIETQISGALTKPYSAITLVSSTQVIE